jgi:carbon monoxide dehydrogenase subunit G
MDVHARKYSSRLIYYHMTKFHVEVNQTVKAPIEKVFAAATDYESIPKWSKVYTSMHVTRREGNVVYTEGEMRAFGIASKGTGKTIETSERIETEGEGKNSSAKVVVTLGKASEGTKLSYVADMELRGPLASILGPFAKGKVESGLRDEGLSFAKYVEEL